MRTLISINKSIENLQGRWAHYAIFSLPREVVLVLNDHEPWPPGIVAEKAILAWQGHASDLFTALEAAF